DREVGRVVPLSLAEERNGRLRVADETQRSTKVSQRSGPRTAYVRLPRQIAQRLHLPGLDRFIQSATPRIDFGNARLLEQPSPDRGIPALSVGPQIVAPVCQANYEVELNRTGLDPGRNFVVRQRIQVDSVVPKHLLIAGRRLFEFLLAGHFEP